MDPKTPMNVSVKEPSPAKKFFSNFFQGDFKTVGAYLLYDLVLPTIKDTFRDALHSTIDILTDGDTRYSRRAGRGSAQRFNYSSISSNKNSTVVRSEDLRTSVIKTVVFSDPQDAENVLDTLCAKIDAEGCCSVADYYEVCNQKSDFTDHKWGWDTLASAKPRRVNGGYIINLPRPIRL